MKKKRLLALILTIFVALSCVSVPAFAAETQQLIVNKPSSYTISNTTYYLPYGGSYIDMTGTRFQFIQHADTITAMNGQKITKMTFRVHYGDPTDAIFEVRLMETDTVAFTDNLLDVTNATLVYTGSAAHDSSSGQVVIPFTTPYIYQGGNLLVEFRVKTAGTNSPNSIYFSATKNVGYNCGIWGDSTSSYTVTDLPTVTFDYAAADYYLDLEDSETYPDSKTIDQNYTLTANGTTTYTDTTKVKVEWTLPTIAATYTSAKVWDPDTMSWVETKTTDTLDEKTATFTFTNYSSVAVGAKVSFAKAIGTDTDPYASELLTLETIVNDDHSLKSSAATSGTITHKYTPLNTDFNSLSAGSGTYGTYTVSIVSAKKVTFDMQGQGTQVAAQYVGTGGKVTEPEDPTPSLDDYVFWGWYTDEDCTGNRWDFDTDTVTEDITLYANWQKLM